MVDTQGVGADGHTVEAACLNCGTALAGEYCHACGQRRHVHRTLSAFGHDLLHGVFHVEGKVLRTLPMLAWCPGILTRRYVEGQRARFVSPIALFLFSIFLMFAVVGSFGDVSVGNDADVKSGLQSNLQREEQKLVALKKERAGLVARGLPTVEIDQRIQTRSEDVNLLRTVGEKGVVRGSAVRVSDNLPEWIRQPVEHASRNPDLLLYKLRNNAYKYSWALIPISVPFLWLLFPFSRRFRLYDHTVFVTFSLAFMTLLLVVAVVLGAVGLGAVAGLLMVVPPIHMYRQLRGAYALGRIGALWRTVLLILFSVTAAGLFAALLLALGLF